MVKAQHHYKPELISAVVKNKTNVVREDFTEKLYFQPRLRWTETVNDTHSYGKNIGSRGSGPRRGHACLVHKVRLGLAGVWL